MQSARSNSKSYVTSPLLEQTSISETWVFEDRIELRLANGHSMLYPFSTEEQAQATYQAMKGLGYVPSKFSSLKIELKRALAADSEDEYIDTDALFDCIRDFDCKLVEFDAATNSLRPAEPIQVYEDEWDEQDEEYNFWAPIYDEEKLLLYYRMEEMPDVEEWHTHFLACNRKRLKALGDKIPGAGPFTVYRGVSDPARVDGLSWTSDVGIACWFSNRLLCGENPVVAMSTVTKEEIFAYTNARAEKEFIVRPKRSEILPLTKEQIQELMTQPSHNHK